MFYTYISPHKTKRNALHLTICKKVKSLLFHTQHKGTQQNAPCSSETAKVEHFITLAGTTSFLQAEIQQLRPTLLSSIWVLSPAAS
jgi:hypothetical protein